MDKTAVLRSVTFGDRVAENEAANLRRYFVETDQWRKALSGVIDVFYGSKGLGKSAIYSLLHEHTNELFDRSIIFIAAENPCGATAFKDIIAQPPTTEIEFQLLWKLYFLTLVADAADEYGITTDNMKAVTKQLTEAGLLTPRQTLAGCKVRQTISKPAVRAGYSVN